MTEREKELAIKLGTMIGKYAPIHLLRTLERGSYDEHGKPTPHYVKTLKDILFLMHRKNAQPKELVTPEEMQEIFTMDDIKAFHELTMMTAYHWASVMESFKSDEK